MDETVYVIFGRTEEDGTITELGRAAPGDYVDPIVEIPGYAAAIRRGTNISFHSNNEELMKKLRKHFPHLPHAAGDERGRGPDGPAPTATRPVAGPVAGQAPGDSQPGGVGEGPGDDVRGAHGPEGPQGRREHDGGLGGRGHGKGKEKENEQ